MLPSKGPIPHPKALPYHQNNFPLHPFPPTGQFQFRGTPFHHDTCLATKLLLNKHAREYHVILLSLWVLKITWGSKVVLVFLFPNLYKIFFILTVHSCINLMACSILESLCFLNSSRTNCVPISEKAGGSFLWRHSSLLYRAITCILWALHDRDIDEVSEWLSFTRRLWSGPREKTNQVA